MQHEILSDLVSETIDDLLIASGTERDRDQCLSFPSCKQGRTVCTRHQSDLAFDLTDILITAAVRPFAFEDKFSYHVFFYLAEDAI